MPKHITSDKSKKRPSNNKKNNVNHWFNPNASVTFAFKVLFALFLIFSGLYFTIGYLSYLFVGKKDQSIVYNTEPSDLLSDQHISNSSGSFGAYSMHSLVNNWMGISVIFLFILAMWMGFILIKQLKFNQEPFSVRKRLLHSAFVCISSMVWGALFFGVLSNALFSETFFYLGGTTGKKMAEYCTIHFGVAGTVIILVFLLLFILFFSFKSFPSKFMALFDGDSELTEEIDPIEPENMGTEDTVSPTPTTKKKRFQWFKWKKSNIQEVDGPLPVVEPVSESTIEETAETQNKTAEPAPEAVNPDRVEEHTSLNQQYHSSQTTSNEINQSPKPETKVGLEVVQGDGGETLSNKDAERALQNFNTDSPYNPHLELSHFKMPSLSLLREYDGKDRTVDMAEIEENKERITETLKSFSVEIISIKATVGPTVTLYEVVPDSGVRISRIRNLEDDIALSLAALGIRIIAPIPGKGTIGIEVPNKNPQMVAIKSILSSKKFLDSDYELPVAMGRNITNEVFCFDLAKMPHLLVAGATGQGKSVGLNTIIISLLYSKHPSELKFVMVDPKMVEFSVFSKIEKHYLAKLEEEKQPIITDTDRVVNTLNSLCKEMDDRYDLLTKAGVKNIVEYNEKFKKRLLTPQKGHKFLPYIVVIIDEYGDLIMTAGKEIELPLARIAQKARAVGLHAIIATQRPTASIITGTIKANFPGRISFKVYSSIDSRTILDTTGANRLIGKGDMLYSGGNDPLRVQCAFVSTEEINDVVDHISKQQAYPESYVLPHVDTSNGKSSGGDDVDMNNLDEKFREAAQLIFDEQVGSTSLIQRRLSVGFARAGRIMDQLEAAGIVGAQDGSKPREVLIHSQMELEQIFDQSL